MKNTWITKMQNPRNIGLVILEISIKKLPKKAVYILPKYHLFVVHTALTEKGRLSSAFRSEQMFEHIAIILKKIRIFF